MNNIPFLKNNSQVSCPYIKSDIIDYLEIEERRKIIHEDLKFVRTAKYKKTKYWLWQFFKKDKYLGWVIVNSFKRFIILENHEVASWGDKDWDAEKLIIEYHKINIEKK
ncbi:hypothetical protein PQO03_07525 [Lentisphaera profundi]|uniref:Uncharacterized protein n=1 Tax=Lentisphaera profundi TaxID=1658616 RepID=A0ABY7VN91_9BACT|nr:hypothetical protein [Lentisphaera profundi]WDE95568.1 hypothetical protein PQO03_07525 [Lentisphaera profundi]